MFILPLILAGLYADSFNTFHELGTGRAAVLVEAGAVYVIVGDTDTGYASGRAGENGVLEEETGGVGKVVWSRDGDLFVRLGP